MTTDKPDPNEPMPTPASFDELLLDYPEGGGFYQVRKGERMGGADKKGIAHRFLLSEGFLAAKEHGGLSDSEARSFARSISTGSRRIEVIDLIQCSGWNDAMYGASPRKGTRVSKTGRSILLRPQHAPVKAALASGTRPTRNVRVSTGTGANTSWRHYELPWLPAIDRKVLWESGGKTISTVGVWWPDGSTKENPPPWVLALGIEDESGDLSGSWGCPESDGELEIGD